MRRPAERTPRALAALLLASCATTPPAAAAHSGAGASPTPDDFGATWHDGRAELCGYRWSGERYGEPRTGEAVAIFVTEPFDDALHVKFDDPAGREGDEVLALELNLVREFQTGVYDYDTMVSCFVRAGDFTPMKVSFTSAEWCGHVYEELDFREGRTDLLVRSYFQGESTERRLHSPADGVVEEQLLVWLRGLRGAPLEPGASREVPFLPGPFERRLRHTRAAWGTATISRAESARTVEVPAGSFRAVLYAVEASDGRTGTFAIEADAPRRVLAWSWTRDGTVLDAGELTGSRRLRYWDLHREGDEALRAELGL